MHVVKTHHARVCTHSFMAIHCCHSNTGDMITGIPFVAGGEDEQSTAILIFHNVTLINQNGKPCDTDVDQLLSVAQQVHAYWSS